MGNLTSWLEHYGYGLIFLSLFLEMLALPLPGEMMMSYTGLFVFEGKLSWLLSMVSAAGGVIGGVSLSYWIGYRLGQPFVAKYGHRVHLGEAQLARLTKWFEKYGEKLLFIAYFIPGVRHVTGYFCGATRMPFRRYALYAYPGAIFWVGLFITLGKVLGAKWEEYHTTVNHYMIMFGVASGLLAVVIYLYKKYKGLVQAALMDLLSRGGSHFHSLGKVKFLLLGAFVLLAGFVSLMLGMIQDFLGHEFSQFDEVASYIVLAGFGSEWHDQMQLFEKLGTFAFYGPLIVVTAIWILFRGHNRALELIFLIWVVLGGEVLNEGLRMIFHRAGPTGVGIPFLYTFPSKETLTSLVVCGFSAFLLLRHYRNHAAHLVVPAVVILLCLMIGISRIYFGMQYPSDVAAGYVFGGVWVCLNVILLEVLRKLQNQNAR
ncbi:membrane protein DedA with SNARE-associated domain [Paenibacillus taihuensis]|uniref:Membrane protein DedA with SNARE-associated domain n=1 Tax=Paenibacillus taihuensis TaxID=1156355 RepID=A0A3D9SP51_9BACL|nr:bifunctional DedA family/phosphatase PAP2 family protein [Paenibacillus taihuensis]REE94344.1 membrane protein DedA with SNARE-associated domain [Paenibacillus taihuensis]